VNVASLKTVLKRYAGQTDEDPLLEYLNAAYHEFEDAFDWPFLEVRNATLTGAVGDNTITLPADFFKPKLLKDVTNQTDLEYLPESEFYARFPDLTATGNALYYTSTGLTTFQLWPVLNSAITYDLIYQKQLDDLAADTDIPAFPTRYHFGLIYGAAAVALQAESEEDRATAAETKFNDWIGRAIAKFSSRQLGEPDVVRDVMEYSDYR
jgi:hypothetical protein